MLKFEKLNTQIQERQGELRTQIINLEKQKNEAIEQGVNQVLNKINKAKSKETAALNAKDFAKLRKEVLAKKEGAIQPSQIISSRKLGVGDIVLIGESESEGEIIELRGNLAIVAVRGLKTSISLKKLQKIMGVTEINFCSIFNFTLVTGPFNQKKCKNHSTAIFNPFFD